MQGIFDRLSARNESGIDEVSLEIPSSSYSPAHSGAETAFRFPSQVVLILSAALLICASFTLASPVQPAFASDWDEKPSGGYSDAALEQKHEDVVQQQEQEMAESEAEAARQLEEGNAEALTAMKGTLAAGRASFDSDAVSAARASVDAEIKAAEEARQAEIEAAEQAREAEMAAKNAKAATASGGFAAAFAVAGLAVLAYGHQLKRRLARDEDLAAMKSAFRSGGNGGRGGNTR